MQSSGNPIHRWIQVVREVDTYHQEVKRTYDILALSLGFVKSRDEEPTTVSAKLDDIRRMLTVVEIEVQRINQAGSEVRETLKNLKVRGERILNQDDESSTED